MFETELNICNHISTPSDAAELFGNVARLGMTNGSLAHGRRCDKMSHSPCPYIPMTVALVRTAAGFGAHHFMLWCAPQQVLLRTKASPTLRHYQLFRAVRPSRVGRGCDMRAEEFPVVMAV